MNTPNEFIPLREAFLKHRWDFIPSEELFKTLTVSNKGDMWIYNYRDKGLIPLNHPTLIRCRGLVVSSKGDILNYPFDRFFNHNQNEVALVDWSTAQVQEKLDGSLVSVFWNGSEWEITTRGMFYPNSNEEYVDFSELFLKHFDLCNHLPEGICYIFELITKENRIIKEYKDEGVFLIGGRYLSNLTELPQNSLDYLADRLDLHRPIIYDASNINECIKLFEDFQDDDEGLVVVDVFSNRVKIKQESYLELIKIKNLNDQALFDYIRGFSELNPTYIALLPDVNSKIQEIKSVWNPLMFSISNIFDSITDISRYRKEFALEATKYPFKGILFSMLDNRNISTQRIKWTDVLIWVSFLKEAQ